MHTTFQPEPDVLDEDTTEVPDRAILADAEREAAELLDRIDGIMIDEDDHVFQAIHRIAAKHHDLDREDATVARLDTMLPGEVRLLGCVVDVACARWTPEVVAAYYLGIAVGSRIQPSAGPDEKGGA